MNTGTGDRGDEKRKKPGPEPERLKLPHEDWEEAVREALDVPSEGDGDEGEDAAEKGEAAHHGAGR